MNIFEIYLIEISSIIKKNKKKLNLKSLNNFKGMTVENPPPNFDCDLSTNVSLILAKLNKLNPKQLSENIKYLLLKNIKDFEDVNSEGPGFINIRLSNKAIYSQIIDDIAGNTLISCSSSEIKKFGNNNMISCKEVGLKLAEKAKKKGIKNVLFDRSGYLYHGKIKSFAEFTNFDKYSEFGLPASGCILRCSFRADSSISFLVAPFFSPRIL